MRTMSMQKFLLDLIFVRTSFILTFCELTVCLDASTLVSISWMRGCCLSSSLEMSFPMLCSSESPLSITSSCLSCLAFLSSYSSLNALLWSVCS